MCVNFFAVLRAGLILRGGWLVIPTSCAHSCDVWHNILEVAGEMWVWVRCSIVDHGLLMKLIRRCCPHSRREAEKMVRLLYAFDFCVCRCVLMCSVCMCSEMRGWCVWCVVVMCLICVWYVYDVLVTCLSDYVLFLEVDRTVLQAPLAISFPVSLESDFSIQCAWGALARNPVRGALARI